MASPTPSAATSPPRSRATPRPPRDVRRGSSRSSPSPTTSASRASWPTDGCEVIPDGASEDLNATLRQAAAEVGRRWPGATPVTLCADLPALVPDDLAAALRRGRRADVRPRRRRHRHDGVRRARRPLRAALRSRLGRPPPARPVRARWSPRPPRCASTSTTSATSVAPWCWASARTPSDAMSGAAARRARERRATRGVTRRRTRRRLGLLGGRLLGGRLLRGRLLRGRRRRGLLGRGRLRRPSTSCVASGAVFLAAVARRGRLLGRCLLGGRRLGRSPSWRWTWRP